MGWIFVSPVMLWEKQDIPSGASEFRSISFAFAKKLVGRS